MDKSRITAAIWPWGTETRAQMEEAAKAVTSIGYTQFESVKQAIYAYDLDLNAYEEVLKRYNLRPVSFYFHLPKYGEEAGIFENFERELDFVARLGVKIICLQATSMHPGEGKMTKEFKQFELDLVGKFAEFTKKFGIRSNLHPHHNTWCMYEDEIDNLLQNLPNDVLSFAPDTAHLIAGKCDPVAVIRKYADRVNFTHLKDIKELTVQSEGFANAGMEVYSNFCELGTGIVDFDEVFKILKDVGYDGPLCEELDHAPISNEVSAQNNYRFLSRMCEKY